MKRVLATILINATLVGGAIAATDSTYLDSMQKWRDSRESGLRNDNGWLTLAGRFQMKPGVNNFGTGSGNDIVLPPELKGVGPDRIGALVVDPANKKVTLKLAKGVWMTSEGKAFSGERTMGTGTDKRDWVALGRMTMHIIERDGRYILRLANNESKVRENFPGRLWYAADEKFKVDARFVAYPPGKKIPIVNVIDEVSEDRKSVV